MPTEKSLQLSLPIHDDLPAPGAIVDGHELDQRAITSNEKCAETSAPRICSK